jgi:tetratricopeptide (TPR) repeat protein
MRRVVAILTLAAALGPVRAARAGVYNLTDKRALPSIAQNDKQDVRQQLAHISPEHLLMDVGELRAAGLPSSPAADAKEQESTSFRHKYVEQVKELEAKQKQGPLPVTDAINLSACYIRLNRIEPARVLLDATLKDVAADDPYRFLLLLHRAMVYSTNPDLLQRAIGDEKEALASWPKEVKGWSADDLAWYQIAERYYLKYLEAEFVEAQRSTGKPLETAAPIFPKARFDEPGWQYQAGVLPPDTADALPLDALQVAAQLLLWVPDGIRGNRVYYLYAELLNGRGDIVDAHGILVDLENNRSWRSARAHRQVLGEALPKESEAGPVAPPPAVATDLWVPEWRQIIGSFLAGVVVTALVFLQWRQWARHRATG